MGPYLFLLVADCLTGVLNSEVANGRITPIKIARGSPGISNLLFADDSLLFFKASIQEAAVVKGALECFQQGSGQLLSPQK